MLDFRKVGILSFIGFAVLILNTLYYMLQVRYFGIGRDIEYYFITLGLCGFALSLTIVGHVGQLLLPLYLAQKEKRGPKIADDIYSLTFNWMFVFALLITAFLFLSSSFFIRLIVPGFEASDHEVINSLFRVLILALPFQVLNSLFKSLLNAHKVFGRVEVLSFFRILLSILFIVLFFEKLGLYVLVLSYVVDVLLSFLMNIYLVAQLKFNYRFSFVSSWFHPFDLFKKSSAAYLRNGSRELFLFTLTASVSFLPPGILAIYKYTESIFLKISTLVLQPIQTVFFTKFAGDHAKKTDQGILSIRKSLDYCFLYATIVIVFCASFGKEILQLLWGIHFQNTDQEVAFSFFLLHIISLIFFAMRAMFHKSALVYKQVLSIYTALAVSWLLAALFCFFTIRSFGTSGLKFVIIFTPLSAALLSYWVVYKSEKKIRSIFRLSYFVKLISLLLISIIAGYFINGFITIIAFGFTERVNLFFTFTVKSLLLSLVIIPQLVFFKLLGFLRK